MVYRTASRRPRRQPTSFTWPAAVVGLFLILIGLGVIAFWVTYVFRGHMPQGIWTVENNVYIIYHQAAEVLAALLAIVGGFGLLMGRGWGMATSLAALGALLYSSINSLAHSVKNAPELTPIFLGVAGAVFLSFVALHYTRRY